ncbi:MAG TPA: antitoxin Xre-like helix-turn-helix domain-containing protein [Gammaproteobacteria bacterium]|nr:antitoxin Xre-like helix-turn-helix domain-containing protein [Gammaproteobacteria bacterium]
MATTAEKPLEAREDLARAGLEAFFNVAGKWNLSPGEQQILLGVGESTYYKWCQLRPRRLNRETLERISHILGIYKDLHILLQKPEDADSWLRRPNHIPLFRGRPAMDRMLAGDVSDLFVVRQYLNAQRVGWT